MSRDRFPQPLGRDYIRPSNLWRRLSLAVVVLFLVVAAAHNGNAGYIEKIEQWTDEKLARVARAQRMDRAVIWSKRCERQGRDALAKRADREPWTIHCVPRTVLRVPA